MPFGSFKQPNKKRKKIIDVDVDVVDGKGLKYHDPSELKDDNPEITNYLNDVHSGKDDPTPKKHWKGPSEADYNELKAQVEKLTKIQIDIPVGDLLTLCQKFKTTKKRWLIPGNQNPDFLLVCRVEAWIQDYLKGLKQ
jgi:hypothetical protein